MGLLVPAHARKLVIVLADCFCACLVQKAFDLCLSGHYKQRVHGMVTYW